MLGQMLLVLVCVGGIVGSSIPIEQSNIVLTNDNWEQILDGEWFIKFYAPWCPACRAMEQNWMQLADWAPKHNVHVASCDVTQQTALNGRFMVTSLPTLYHVKEGEFRVYKKSRELDNLKDFIANEEWKELEPVSQWTSPTSFLMSGMSNMFSFSLAMKDYHDSLSESYNLPSWLSFLALGLVIITFGLVLGIVFVLVSEYFYPPEPYRHPKKDDGIINKDDQNTEVNESEDGVNDKNAVRQRKPIEKKEEDES